MSRDRDTGGEAGFGQSRREFLRALGGAIGVALASDPSTIGELAEAAAKRKGKGKLPSGYVFHPVLIVDPNSPGVGDMSEIMAGVMINDRSEVIFHAHTSSGARAVYRMQIGRGRKPGASTPRLIVQSGQTLPDGMVAERIASGDTNGSGTYVTVIRAKKQLEGVYIQRPGQSIQPLLKANDRTPGPNGRYSGSFGDIDLDARGDIVLVARYTVPGEVHHGLFYLPRGNRNKGKILLRTGHRIPNTKAIVTGLGLVERRGGSFIAQVFGRQARHRRSQNSKLEPSGFLVGKLSKGRRGARLLVGAKQLKIDRSVIKGNALVGPRVDRDGTAATVTHKRGSHLALHRHRRGAGHGARLANTGNKSRRGAKVATISAPVFGPRGLLFYRTISEKGMELFVVREDERRMIFESYDKVGGVRVKGFNFGWHTDQVDSRGRLAFQAQLVDGRTAIVIGSPV